MAYEQLKLDNQLCFRLYTASHLVTAAYGPYFKDSGITYPQYLVLMCLWEKDNCIVSEITGRLHLETNTITPLLQRMEKQGLIVRHKSQSDCRQRLISLTKEGMALEEKLKDVPNCLATEILDNGASADSLKELISSLDNLIMSIRHMKTI